MVYVSRLSSLPPSCGASRFFDWESGSSAKDSCSDWPRLEGMKRSLYCGLREAELGRPPGIRLSGVPPGEAPDEPAPPEEDMPSADARASAGSQSLWACSPLGCEACKGCLERAHLCRVLGAQTSKDPTARAFGLFRESGDATMDDIPQAGLFKCVRTDDAFELYAVLGITLQKEPCARLVTAGEVDALLHARLGRVFDWAKLTPTAWLLIGSANLAPAATPPTTGKLEMHSESPTETSLTDTTDSRRPADEVELEDGDEIFDLFD